MESNFVWDNLKFFVDTLKFLPVSESLTLSQNGSCCVSTGTYSENWVYCSEREITPEMADMAVNFFRERGDSGETFMWPVYADSESNREILEGAGLIYAGNLTAMCLDSAKITLARNNDAVKIEGVKSREMAEVWAETASRGFGEDGASDSYRKFAESLCAERERVGLYLAGYGGEYAGTFCVTEDPEMTGVYYFAVVPEFRRKGVARAMMSEICRLSAGRKIVLQATPIGAKFYGAFGFEELFRIPVYSTDGDIL